MEKFWKIRNSVLIDIWEIALGTFLFSCNEIFEKLFFFIFGRKHSNPLNKIRELDLIYFEGICTIHAVPGRFIGLIIKRFCASTAPVSGTTWPSWSSPTSCRWCPCATPTAGLVWSCGEAELLERQLKLKLRASNQRERYKLYFLNHWTSEIFETLKTSVTILKGIF